jgi:hypothetical protein
MKNWEKIKNTISVMNKIDMPKDYDIERISEYIQGLFSHAKFHIGDRIKMSKTYPINSEDSWGWMPYKHILVEGSKGIVRERDWTNGAFIYSIEFEEKSWVDSKGEIHFSDTANIFSLSEKWLNNI